MLDPIVHVAQVGLDPKSNTDFETVRYCLLVFGQPRLAHKSRIAFVGSSRYSGGYCKHRDVKCRQHAVFVIGNLCANPANLEAIVNGGCLKPLCLLLFQAIQMSNSRRSPRCVFVGDQNIRMSIVRAGALEPLILAANSESVEVQRETAATLCSY